VTTLGLDVIGKLRCDADLCYVYTGKQKPRGRKRKYDGKVDLTDVSPMTLVSEIEPVTLLNLISISSLFACSQSAFAGTIYFPVRLGAYYY